MSPEPPDTKRAPAAVFDADDVARELGRIAEECDTQLADIAARCLDEGERPDPSAPRPLVGDPLTRRIVGLALTAHADPHATIEAPRHDELMALVNERFEQVDNALREQDDPAVANPWNAGEPTRDPASLIELRMRLGAILDRSEHADTRDGALAPRRRITDLLGDTVSELAGALAATTRRSVVNERLVELVCAGQGPLARRIAHEHGHHDPDLSLSDERTISALIRAGASPPPDPLSLFASGAHVRAEFAYATEPSRPEAEPATRPWVPAPSVADDADTAIAQMHGILRAHARDTRALAHPRGHRLVARIGVSERAFAQLHARLHTGPAWRGQSICATERAGVQEGRYDIGVLGELRVDLAGQIITVEFATTLERREHWGDNRAAQLARDIYGESFAATLGPLGVITGTQPTRWHPVERAEVGASAPAIHEAIGPERCAHPDARWVSHPHRYTPYLALVCPRCLHERLAIRPDLDGTDTPEGLRRFTAAQNAQRILAGEDPSDDTAALLARARAIPTDPGAYATDITHTDAAPRTPSRQVVRSVADAMRRR